MKKFGLIGKPISTSKSPALFKAGYHGKYSYDLIETDSFETAWKRFLDEYQGINVTAPYKLDAFALAELRSEGCEKIGAANLILKTEKGIYATNTDFAGIVLSLLDAYWPGGGHAYFEKYGDDFSEAADALLKKTGRRPQAIVAGCGGAGRAAAAAVAVLGCENILMNRTVEKAEAIAEDMSEYSFQVASTEAFTKAAPDSDIIIYTIPGPIPELAATDWGSRKKIILEANYKVPSLGPESEVSLSKNCTYVSGKRWLLYQALSGYSIFTGEKPDFDQMCKVF